MCQLCLLIKDVPINDNPERSIEIASVNAFVLARISPQEADAMLCETHLGMVNHIINEVTRDPIVAEARALCAREDQATLPARETVASRERESK